METAKLKRVFDLGAITYTKKIMSVCFYVTWTALATAVYARFVTVYYAIPPTPIFYLFELLFTIALLWVGSRARVVSVTSLDSRSIRRIIPLLLIYFVRMGSSLDGVQRTDKPLFNVSCRFVLQVTSTMLFERILFDSHMGLLAQLSVAGMTAGAMIAGVYEEPIQLGDYILIVMNNVFSAAHGVYSKYLLDSRELGLYGLWYYNSFIILVPSLCVAYLLDILSELFVDNWYRPLFWCHVFVMAVMGLVSSYAQLLCMFYNGALTTTIVTSLSSTMKIWLDLLYSEFNKDNVSTWHYLGLSITAFACLAYLYDTFDPRAGNIGHSQNAEDSA